MLLKFSKHCECVPVSSHVGMRSGLSPGIVFLCMMNELKSIQDMPLSHYGTVHIMHSALSRAELCLQHVELERDLFRATSARSCSWCRSRTRRANISGCTPIIHRFKCMPSQFRNCCQDPPRPQRSCAQSIMSTHEF